VIVYDEPDPDEPDDDGLNDPDGMNDFDD